MINKITLIIYNAINYIIQPLIFIKLIWRSKYNSNYRHRINERYGFHKKKIKNKGIILHSVSIGETLAAIPLIHGLQKLYPNIPITITSTTPTGMEQAKTTLKNQVNYSYLPYDLPGAMNRFINYIDPILVIIMETEIWPNLIQILHKKKIPCIIANARMSSKSAKNYKKIKPFIKYIINHITLIAAQNEDDGSRFLELGLQKNRLAITGNLKFEISVNKKLKIQALKLRQKWNKKNLIWLAASTHPGEEKILLETHKTLLTIFPNLLMIIAPRHPERCIKIKKIIKKTGLNYILRSNKEIPLKNTQIIINDTIGELMLLYGTADLAFIGGSLINHGGHNPLEAAAHGLPIIMGPYTFNFHNICIKLTQENGLITITDKNSLIETISNLLTNKNLRLHYGSHAIKYLYNNQGTLNKLLYLLKPYLK